MTEQYSCVPVVQHFVHCLSHRIFFANTSGDTFERTKGLTVLWSEPRLNGFQSTDTDCMSTVCTGSGIVCQTVCVCERVCATTHVCPIRALIIEQTVNHKLLGIFCDYFNNFTNNFIIFLYYNLIIIIFNLNENVDNGTGKLRI